MELGYIAQPKDYWIAPNALTITRNALGEANRIQGSVASGAVIACYIEGITEGEGLGYGVDRNPKRWPLSLSPTFFNNDEVKYVYVAIPRSATIGSQAVVVFPSEKLDIYGRAERIDSGGNKSVVQVGSNDYYYIWTQGLLGAPFDTPLRREWVSEIDFGKLGTAQGQDEKLNGSEWYEYSPIMQMVTLLKNITMKAGTTFLKLFLGNKELNGVATNATTSDFVDSETLVATPSYIKANYLSKTTDDEAAGEIGFKKGLWVKSRGLFGIDENGHAVFEDVRATSVTAADGLQIGDTYQEGLGGVGGVFRMIDGKSYLEADRIYVRMKAYFDTLEIRRYLHSGGNRVASAAGCKVSRVVGSGDGSFYRLCFKATDGDNTVTNDFQAGDFAYCHTTNLAGGDFEQQDYWRLVMRYGSLNAQSQIVSLNGTPRQDVEDTVVTEHFIDVSNTIESVDIGEDESYPGMMAGSTTPKAEDDVVQLGHAFDRTRQGAIIEAVSGVGQAPTYRIYQGINSFALPAAKIDMGYNTETGQAYIKIGDSGSYLRFNNELNSGLEIKAKIDAQSPVGNTTLSGLVGSAVTTAEEYTDGKIADYTYLKEALAAAAQGSTQILGGLVLSQYIALKNSANAITAGLNGDNGSGRDIAAWFGGNPYAQTPVAPKIAFRFDGSGYLAGGNISWDNAGNTTVNGTVRAAVTYRGYAYISVMSVNYPTPMTQDETQNLLDLTGGVLPSIIVLNPVSSNTYSGSVAETQRSITLRLPSPQTYEGIDLDIYCAQDKATRDYQDNITDVFVKVVLDADEAGIVLPGAGADISFGTVELNNLVGQTVAKTTRIRLHAAAVTNGNGTVYRWLLMGREESNFTGVITGGSGGGGVSTITREEVIQYDAEVLANANEYTDGEIRELTTAFATELGNYVLTSTLASTLGGYVANTQNGINEAIALLSGGSDVPTDGTLYLSQKVSSTGELTFNLRPHSKLWDYIKVKADAVYVNTTTLAGYLPLSGGTLTGDMEVSVGSSIWLNEIGSSVSDLHRSQAASRWWVGQQGFLTSANLGGYATTSALTSGLAGKQNIIHFLNNKDNDTEVGVSYFHLPLSYSGAGHVSLDLSDYATQSWVNNQGFITSAGLSGATVLGARQMQAVNGTAKIVAVRFPDYEDFNDMGWYEGRSEYDYYRAVLRWLCQEYATTYGGNAVFQGIGRPSSVRFMTVIIYDLSAVDGNGLPLHSFATASSYGDGGPTLMKFGTDEYNFYAHGEHASTADQLKTARTLWGQTFDGSGNVSGSLSLGDGAVTFSEGSIEAASMDNRAMHITNTYGNFFFHGSNTASTLYADTFSQTSDIRKKTDVTELPLTSAQIATARAISFRFTGDTSGRFRVGTVAQDWQYILPDAVTAQPDGTLTMDYAGAAIASVIAVARDVTALQQTVTTQQDEIAALKEEVAALKALVKAMAKE